MESEAKTDQLDTRREELLKSLSPKEEAIFKFLEHLGKLEKQPRSKNDPKLKISWDYGISTEKRVNAALSGNTSLLPVPRKGRYTTFEWFTGYKLDLDVRRQYKSLEEYRAAFPSKGSSDIRIYDMGDSLRFFANTGSFEGVEKDWAEAVDDIPYPIQVKDRHGFRYENPAYRKAKSG